MINMKLVPRNYYDLFDNFFLDERDDFGGMKCDIYEKHGKYHIDMDIPGFNKEEIKIECNKGNLIVSAEKKNETEEKDEKKYIRRERSYGRVQRSFYLGDVDEDKIEANFHNGTLHVVVPKKEEKDTKKYIEVK